MSSLERKLKRNKLKNLKGDNKISGAWQKYMKLEKIKKENKKNAK